MREALQSFRACPRRAQGFTYTPSPLVPYLRPREARQQHALLPHLPFVGIGKCKSGSPLPDFLPDFPGTCSGVAFPLVRGRSNVAW